jgi:hypothetical protein
MEHSLSWDANSRAIPPPQKKIGRLLWNPNIHYCDHNRAAHFGINVSRSRPQCLIRDGWSDAEYTHFHAIFGDGDVNERCGKR